MVSNFALLLFIAVAVAVGCVVVAAAVGTVFIVPAGVGICY